MMDWELDIYPSDEKRNRKMLPANFKSKELTVLYELCQLRSMGWWQSLERTEVGEEHSYE